MLVLRKQEVALLGALLVIGCTSMPGKENVQAFSAALTAATDQLDQAVVQLAKVERDQSLEDSSARYTAPRRPGASSLSAPEMPTDASPNADAARVALGDMLQVLAAYSKSLSAVVGGEDLAAAQTAFQGAATRAGSTLGKLGVSNPQVAQVSGAIGSIGNIIIELKTASEVTSAVRRASPAVHQIVDFISVRIIGDDGGGITAAMRMNARAASDFQIRSLDVIALDPKVNAYQRDQAYRDAVARHRARQALVRVPGATREALAKLDEAHAALVRPETAGSSVEDFIKAVRRVVELYEAGQPAAK